MWWTIPYVSRTCLHVTFTCLTPLKEAQKNHMFGFCSYGSAVIPKAADREFYGGYPSAGASIECLRLHQLCTCSPPMYALCPCLAHYCRWNICIFIVLPNLSICGVQLTFRNYMECVWITITVYWSDYYRSSVDACPRCRMAMNYKHVLVRTPLYGVRLDVMSSDCFVHISEHPLVFKEFTWMTGVKLSSVKMGTSFVTLGSRFAGVGQLLFRPVTQWALHVAHVL